MAITSVAPTDPHDQQALHIALLERRIADLERTAGRDIAGSLPFTSRYVPLAGGVLLTDAAQTIATATVTDITWGTEVADPDGWTAGGIATLTVPAGKGMRYIVSYNGQWTVDPGALGSVVVIFNGANLIEAPPARTASFIFSESIVFVRTLAAGDTLKFSANHAAGASRDIVSRLEIAPI